LIRKGSSLSLLEEEEESTRPSEEMGREREIGVKKAEKVIALFCPVDLYTSKTLIAV
jgi:hypothetical protein